jgi:hypothetical protein
MTLFFEKDEEEEKKRFEEIKGPKHRVPVARLNDEAIKSKE